MLHQYLRLLYLALTTAHLCASEGSVCDQNWIYRPSSSLCLQSYTASVKSPMETLQVCKSKTKSSSSGRLVSLTRTPEHYIKEYMQFMNISRAVVQAKTSWLQNHGFRYTRTAAFHEYLNQTIILFLSYFDVPIIIRAADATGNSISWEFVPHFYSGPVICQMDANISAAPQPPGCPDNVRVEALSDNNVTLYLEPGVIKSKITIRFKPVETCDNETISACEVTDGRLVHNVFLTKPQNYTVVGLLPNTRYKIHFETEGIHGRVISCNETVDITTVEVHPLLTVVLTHYSATPMPMQHKDTTHIAVVGTDKMVKENQLMAAAFGLTGALALSLSVILVLVILYCRLLREMRQDNSSHLAHSKPTSTRNRKKNKMSHLIKEETKKEKKSASLVGTTTTTSFVDKDDNVDNSVGDYGNIRDCVMQNYDKTSENMDDHIYEM